MKRTVLCIPDKAIDPQVEGFIPCSSFADLNKILGREIWAVPRDVAENDATFRQIIPYVTLLTEQGQVLTYQRGKAGQEGRLHALWSIGIGGHTEIFDLFEEDLHDKVEDCWEFLAHAALREVVEELPNSWVEADDMSVAGVIRLSSSEVDAVHVGVWILAIIPPNEMEAVLAGNEDTIEKADWAYIEQLEGLELEAWSDLALKRLIEMFSCACQGNCQCKDQHCRDDDGA